MDEAVLSDVASPGRPGGRFRSGTAHCPDERKEPRECEDIVPRGRKGDILTLPQSGHNLQNFANHCEVILRQCPNRNFNNLDNSEIYSPQQIQIETSPFPARCHNRR